MSGAARQVDMNERFGLRHERIGQHRLFGAQFKVIAKSEAKAPDKAGERNSRRDVLRKCDGSSYQVTGLVSLIVF